MREFRTSGSVRDGDGNVPIYSAIGAAQRREHGVEGAFVGERRQIAEEGQSAGLVQRGEAFSRKRRRKRRESIVEYSMQHAEARRQS